jgi:hypothetical protein
MESQIRHIETKGRIFSSIEDKALSERVDSC